MFHLLLAALALVCAQAHSQTMYRCGNVYQDRPCDAGKAGRAVGSTGTAGTTGTGTAAPAAADAECAQRGKDSLKIVWSREGGATEERLISEAPTAPQKRFVQDVYRRRGSASQVEAAVAADCVAEKRQREQDAAFAAAAAALRGQREDEPPTAPPAVQAPVQPAQAANDAERRKARCAAYSRQMDDLRERERSGGSGQTMDRLRESRRRLGDEMSRSGC